MFFYFFYFYLKSCDSSRERSEARLWLQASFPDRAEHSWVQELCESRGGHPGLPSPNKPYVFFCVNTKHPDWRRKAEQGCCQLIPTLPQLRVQSVHVSTVLDSASHPPLVHFQRQHWGPSIRGGGAYNDIMCFLKFTDCHCCCFYIVLFSTLKQTHCTRMCFCMDE